MTFTFNRIPLTEAIAFFQEKINIPTGSWSDLEEIEHTVAFTVAGLKAEILADARAILDKLIVEGTSIDEARASFNQLIARTGWLEDKTTKQKAWRVETIIDTNLKTSNAIGRYAYQNDPDVVKAMPYYLNRHGDSIVPRPVHKKLDGIVYRRDDPRASALYRPSGFRCSCLTFVISEREYLAKYKGTDRDYVTIDVPFTVMIDGKELSTDADTGFKLAPNMPNDERRAEIVARMAGRLPKDINAVFLDEVGKIGDRYPEQFDNQAREPKGSSKGGQFAKKQVIGVDAEGKNYVGLNLKNADFKGKDLRGADFSNANLLYADFSDANLEGAMFAGAYLASSNFTNANLQKAKLYNTELNSSNFTKADLREANLEVIKAANVNFFQAQMQQVQMTDSFFAGAKFNKANMSNANLSNSDFEEANFNKTNLSGAIIKNANFLDASLKSANLTRSIARLSNFENTRLDKADFTKADLREANFRYSEIKNAKFQSAKLENSILDGLDFSQVDLKGVDLEYASIDDSLRESLS
jgi:uncharacterized protein YjbI with pentapeptide repeats